MDGSSDTTDSNEAIVACRPEAEGTPSTVELCTLSCPHPKQSYQQHDSSLTKRSLVVTLISKRTITSATRSTLWRHFTDFCQAESSRTQTKSRGPHRNISLVVKTLKENENKSALRISMLTLTYITFWTHPVVALLSVQNPISIN